MKTITILRIWAKKGLITADVNTPLYKTARKFAKAICEMDGEDAEKRHFAESITKIWE